MALDLMAIYVGIGPFRLLGLAARAMRPHKVIEPLLVKKKLFKSAKLESPSKQN